MIIVLIINDYSDKLLIFTLIIIAIIKNVKMNLIDYIFLFIND